jgi:ATP-dependent Clp protease ATP-binding subunit ClpC
MNDFLTKEEDLAIFGTDLTALAATGSLPHAFKVEQPLRTLLEMVQRVPRRSIVIIGKAGSGKTSLINELVYALARPENGSWRVLRIQPTEFMAGTKYLGEWETRVSSLVKAVKSPRRVVAYVPNVGDLVFMGRWEKSDANVATALAPHLENGTILLLGESTPEEFDRGLGSQASLSRLFDTVLIEESGLDDTRGVLAGIRDEARAPVSDDVLKELLEISEFYLSHVARPGGAAELLRQVIANCRETGRSTTRRDVLDLLSQSIGVPCDLLDDSKPLDLPGVRAFFERRIIGQPEAVGAVVDVVTLIKAGLTDPGKPFSVMLFVGPTGVGKTELARALAEYIFGDAARLQRFDMSEFASIEGFTRLIGRPGESGLLTEAVRQRPFSVVLLDEIEKSNVIVFDLFLQFFDAGRLTDGRGRLVDFRRTIVILTSNIGAESPAAPVGFGLSDQPRVPATDQDRTWREITRFFRPEFLNRLDRIVTFRPLSLQVTEMIARRELDAVLQRSGVIRRNLTVNVDPSVISLLVRKGYSPHFGARPLRRTVETLALLPLARIIASGQVESRALLSLTARGDRIDVHLTPPTRAGAGEFGEARTVRVAARERSAELRNRFEQLQPQIRRFADRKTELVARTQQQGFYQDDSLRDATFDELHKLDDFLSRCDQLREALDRLAELMLGAKSRRTDAAGLQGRVEELASELDQLEWITRCRDTRELGDAVISLTCVKTEGQPLNAVETLARMYLRLAGRRRMSSAVVAEHYNEKVDVAILHALGIGAFGLFAGEAGLHEFNRRTHVRNSRTGREQIREDAGLVRVEVVPLTAEPNKRFLAGVRTTLAALKPPRTRLIEKARWRVTAFHEPSVRSLDVWCAGSRDAALQTTLNVLHARVEDSADGKVDAAAVPIRRYDLGIGSRIKDLRTGRSTGKVKQFFQGHLEMLASLPDAPGPWSHPTGRP